MIRKYIVRVVVLIGILSLLAALLPGCSSPKYKVDYDGGKMFFEGAKDAYRAGEQVEVVCTLLMTDVDTSFYLDGEYLKAEYDDRKGYILRFTMPEKDVRLEVRFTDSMTYVEPVEAGVLLVDYYRTETAGGDGYYELVLTTTEDPNQYQLDEYRKEDGGEESRTSYLIPFDILPDCLEIAEEYGMRDWNGNDDSEALDGVRIVCKFRDGEETIRVSSEQMPENGEQALEAMRAMLADCLREEFLLSE